MGVSHSRRASPPFYISRAVFPIGEGSVLILDLNGQYVSFFEELRNKLLGGGSLLYSWSRTLGGEFLGIFAYYLASPFSLIVCLFRHASSPRRCC